jgi:hypothetical protein
VLLAKAFAEAGVLEDNPPGSFFDPVLSTESNNTKKSSGLVAINPKGST